MPEWTKEQREAINARNHSILVSAAAGSGKTAVLIERIVTLLREGYRMNRMMIVTFTRAAAAEMRQRLNATLLQECKNDPDRMGQALDDLNSAEISTIHSFCQTVLKNEFQAVNIDPLARICEEQKKKLLFDEAFNQSMNVLLENQDETDFQQLAQAFDMNTLREMVSDLYTFLMSLPDPFEWLMFHVEHMNDVPPEENLWYEVIVRQSGRLLQGLDALLGVQEAMFDEPNAVHILCETWQKDHDAIEKLLTMDAGTPQAMGEALATFSFARAASCRDLSDEEKQWKDRYTAIRKAMKSLVDDATATLNINVKKTCMELGIMQSMLRGMVVLEKQVHEVFMLLKQQENVIDFADLEQMTLQILKQDDLCVAIQQSYDHIFVDECQDMSAVQDAIVQKVHGEKNCLFMVGDVKQSIYRFRLADPTLFLQRMRTWSHAQDAEERSIFLQKNFRSQKNVLEATNIVFRHLMKEDVTELDYLPEDELIIGRNTNEAAPVEIHLINPGENGKSGISALQAQADVFVSRLNELMKERTVIDGVERCYTYRDAVILVPKVANVGSKLADLLKERGVPVYFDGAETYFDLPEIKAMTALLNIIDNPLQDIHLMAVLKQHPFDVTDSDMADIRLCKTGRGVPFHEAFYICCEHETPLGTQCRKIKEQIETWRFMSKVMRLSDFMWMLIRETGFYASCGALPEGDIRQANLRLLCQRAVEYEDQGGVTLSGFLKLMDDLKSVNDGRSAKLLGEGENLVRIMTIHKSKGLEFPIVCCMNMSSPMHLSRAKDIRMHAKLGVCVPYVNRKMNIRRSTMADIAFEIQSKLDEKAEKARLLYVAMTRAKDYLMLLGMEENLEQPLWKMTDGTYRIWSARCMMDWVMQSVLSENPNALKEQLSTDFQQGANPWKIKVWDDIHSQAVENNQVFHNLNEWLNSVVSIPAGEVLWNKWQGIYDEPQRLPLKTSVSALIRKDTMKDPLPVNDEDETPETKRKQEDIVSPLRLSEIPSKPAFMESAKLTGSQRGTIMHHALALFDLNKIRTADNLISEVTKQLEHFTECGCITKEERSAVNVSQICHFYKSELGQRILQSDTVKREWNFNMVLSEQGETLLQGVIDCAFMEKDAWIIVDYKTDIIHDENAFVQRYQQQLALYAQALEKITGRKVASCWLYALSKQKPYGVSLMA